MARKIELDQFYDVVNEIPKWQEKDQSTTVGDVVFTTKSSTIKIGHKDVILSQSQAAMFKLLVLHAGETVSREKLCHPACGIDVRYLTAHMHYFRKRLGRKVGSRIQTVVGKGYVYIPLDATFQKQSSFRLNEQTLRAAMLRVPGPLTANKRNGK
jgi:DNA-binding winged helix-turn-helix (wHTH) protein